MHILGVVDSALARYEYRVRFNEQVVDILRRYLERRNLRIGVIIAATFVEIRLRTLISYGLTPKKVSRLNEAPDRPVSRSIG